LVETMSFEDVETDTAVFTEDGILYSGNDNGEIVTKVGSTLTRTRAHNAGIKRLTYTHSRRLLLSSSYDRTFKLWSVANDGRLEMIQCTDVPSCIWLRSCAFAGNSRLVFATFGTSYA